MLPLRPTSSSLIPPQYSTKHPTTATTSQQKKQPSMYRCSLCPFVVVATIHHTVLSLSHRICQYTTTHRSSSHQPKTTTSKTTEEDNSLPYSSRTGSAHYSRSYLLTAFVRYSHAPNHHNNQHPTAVDQCLSHSPSHHINQYS
mmetsp:Transcript_9841/g.13481  ORF Transcript_9841/g.13481 Transcript_9841/m.13481 type:complete len:143 (+) Transcript_9841:35-463(+)